MTASPPDAAPDQRWPGERLGLPETGPRSVARLGRRIAALVIDWAIAYLLSWAFFPTPDGTAPFVTLGIFAALQFLFLLIVNGSVGHLLLRMRLVPLRGGYLGAWRPLVRTVLLCLVIPAAIWDRDQRGLHDKAAGTVLVRV
ncbi:RDD family protein [Protaetiibacter intestinalis]|uniref:RDD family protein n=1 Tax=Protaetiibacter intestinalis TaxID=2419774 RepID=A0A387BDM1_9MICO|nr:RDD family protein [Protaetiibacter intestinalis]AYF98989.1 RDD family protein [Protaetiibacter intestinalis]